jgi:hypothetical protein
VSKEGESVREMLRQRSTEKALSTFAMSKLSPEEAERRRKAWNEKIGGKPRRRPWK